MRALSRTLAHVSGDVARGDIVRHDLSANTQESPSLPASTSEGSATESLESPLDDAVANALQVEIARQEQLVAEKEGVIDKIVAKAVSQANELKDQAKQLAAKSNKALDLQSKVRTLNQNVQRLEELVKVLKAKHDASEKVLKARVKLQDKKIAHLKKLLAEKDKKIEDLELSLEVAKSRIEDLEANVRTCKAARGGVPWARMERQRSCRFQRLDQC